MASEDNCSSSATASAADVSSNGGFSHPRESSWEFLSEGKEESLASSISLGDAVDKASSNSSTKATNGSVHHSEDGTGVHSNGTAHHHGVGDHTDCIQKNGGAGGNGRDICNGESSSTVLNNSSNYGGTINNYSSNNSSTSCNNVVHRRTKPTLEEREAALKKFGLPTELPSLRDIRKALPPHVFESSAWRSLYYVAKDAVIMLVLFLLAEHLWSCPHTPRWLLWIFVPVYWLVQVRQSLTLKLNVHSGLRCPENHVRS
jgi:hypothetical protein